MTMKGLFLKKKLKKIEPIFFLEHLLYPRTFKKLNVESWEKFISVGLIHKG